ncbi:Gluconate transport-inducing protein [Coemansia sp. RSA 552]|nr:Gluconate transport-inducing protein [Coemansia sp. RSA 552]
MNPMDVATYSGYIETSDDALLLFEACRLEILQRRKRRLCERERSSIGSGSVFVWEEHESGIQRWTDGMRWSPSRVAGPFLVYTQLEPKKPATPSATSTVSASSSSLLPDVPLEDGLTKKSLSLIPSDGSKLHVACYFRKRDVESGRLVTPARDPRLREIKIPRRLYPEILPQMCRALAPNVLPVKTLRRLSGTSATILARGCASHQLPQLSQCSPPRPGAPTAFAAGPAPQQQQQVSPIRLHLATTTIGDTKITSRGSNQGDYMTAPSYTANGAIQIEGMYGEAAMTAPVLMTPPPPPPSQKSRAQSPVPEDIALFQARQPSVIGAMQTPLTFRSISNPTIVLPYPTPPAARQALPPISELFKAAKYSSRGFSLAAKARYSGKIFGSHRRRKSSCCDIAEFAL